MTDSNGNPVSLAGEAINITVNGKTYQRKTNSEGIASLPINLAAKTYEIASEYDGKVLIRTLIVNKA